MKHILSIQEQDSRLGIINRVVTSRSDAHDIVDKYFNAMHRGTIYAAVRRHCSTSCLSFETLREAIHFIEGYEFPIGMFDTEERIAWSYNSSFDELHRVAISSYDIDITDYNILSYTDFVAKYISLHRYSE